jgi:hypothetical protein
MQAADSKAVMFARHAEAMADRDVKRPAECAIHPRRRMVNKEMMLEQPRSLDQLQVDGQEVSDPVFGRQRVEEPVLLELLETDVVRRLAGVHQAGASYLVRPGRDVMRFEHSVGVMLLIRQLGGDLSEQVSGLLHDVSHTAFSHVLDRVHRRKDEDYHERLVHD